MRMQKLCPKCKTPAAIDQKVCGLCSHVFRTNFTKDGTQEIEAPKLAASAAQPVPGSSNSAAGCALVTLVLAIVAFFGFMGSRAEQTRGFANSATNPNIAAQLSVTHASIDKIVAPGTGEMTYAVVIRFVNNGPNPVSEVWAKVSAKDARGDPVVLDGDMQCVYTATDKGVLSPGAEGGTDKFLGIVELLDGAGTTPVEASAIIIEAYEQEREMSAE